MLTNLVVILFVPRYLFDNLFIFYLSPLLVLSLFLRTCVSTDTLQLSFHRNHNSITHRAKVAYSCHASSILFYVYCLFPIFPFLLHFLIKLLFISCFPHIFGYSNYNFHFITLPDNIFLLLFEKEVFPCDSN